MMDHQEREVALARMREASTQFYASATAIGNHPFIEFTGLINEYIRACEDAHRDGIDFSECNTHSERPLPLAPFRLSYMAEKLDCIFTGRIAVRNPNGVAQ